jgi:tetratricopeptide (TPR) repeat protein
MPIYAGIGRTVRIGRLAAACLLALPCTAFAQEAACGSLAFSGYGPFDYRTATSEQRAIVERNHFTPQVENLRQAMTGALGGDLAYTLQAFPNHVRALAAMVRLSKREGKEVPTASPYSIECWFERAVRFRPDDAQVRVLVAMELMAGGRADEARKHLESAEENIGADPNVAYNLGLAYLKLREFDTALKYARIAYGAGYPLPGLRNALVRAGKWKE